MEASLPATPVLLIVVTILSCTLSVFVWFTAKVSSFNRESQAEKRITETLEEVERRNETES